MRAVSRMGGRLLAAAWRSCRVTRSTGQCAILVIRKQYLRRWAGRATVEVLALAEGAHMRLRIEACLVACLAGASPTLANTAIETETAQIGKKGDIGISQSVEYEKATDGTAAGTLTQFEYGITDRSEILIEPFFHLWEFPDDGPRAEGRGDLEITPSYMVLLEKGWIPAILVATKIKVPTGSKEVGGTGKYDYFPYLIFGQHALGWTFNANLGVNFAAPPEGGAPDQTVVWDLETEREFGKVTWFLETYSAEDAVKTVSTALQYEFTEHFNAFLAVGYTIDDAIIVRPGINLEF